MKKLAALLIALTLGVSAVGCSSAEAGQTTEKVDKEIIKIGVNGTDFRVWDYVGDELAKEGIELEVVSFADYIQPNIALSQGEIDINSFQTQIYFDQFITDHNLDLVPIGNTVFAAMGIYSDKQSTVDEISEKGKVAIPNDLTNGGRALLLLEEVGLIELKEGVGATPTIKDIVNNSKQIEIIEMAAQQIPTSLKDVDLGIINSGVAVTAGLKAEEAIYTEDKNSANAENYYNIFAVKKEDEDNEALKRLVEVYQTEPVKDILEEMYEGAQTPLF